MLRILLFRKVVRYPMSIILHDTLICKLAFRILTQWGWLIIFINKLTIIGSDNGLPPGDYLNQCWNIVDGTSALGSNYSEILIEIYTFSLKKMHLKTSSGKCLPFCQCVNLPLHVSLYEVSGGQAYETAASYEVDCIKLILLRPAWQNRHVREYGRLHHATYAPQHKRSPRSYFITWS